MLLAVVNYFRNYPLGLLIAVAFFVSALCHRGFIHFMPRIKHKRVLIGGAVAASAVFLGVGLLAFSIIGTAPVHVIEMPFGVWRPTSSRPTWACRAACW